MSLGPLHTSMTRISDLREAPFATEAWPSEAWASGDYVVAEVVEGGGTGQAELPTGRLVELEAGDRIVGALGRRHATLQATGSWEAVEADGRMHLLTAGGLLGRITSSSSHVPSFPELRYAGHAVRGGEKVTMRAYAPVPEPAATFGIPTILVIGTSMSAGKTQAGRAVIRRLRAMGRRVMAAKLTGAGRYRDILTMGDAGADPIFDFVDAGLPSTACPAGEYRSAIEGLLSRMAGVRADVAVVEVGASPLEPYNGTVAIEMLEPAVRMTILCATDPYAVVGLLAAFDAEPDLVAGIAANTRAGIELVERLVDVPCMNVADREAVSELDRLLRAHLERAGGAG